MHIASGGHTHGPLPGVQGVPIGPQIGVALDELAEEREELVGPVLEAPLQAARMSGANRSAENFFESSDLHEDSCGSKVTTNREPPPYAESPYP